MGKKILVTGGTGTTGSRIAKRSHVRVPAFGSQAGEYLQLPEQNMYILTGMIKKLTETH